MTSAADPKIKPLFFDVSDVWLSRFKPVFAELHKIHIMANQFSHTIFERFIQSAHCEEDDLNELFASSSPIEISANETLIHQGERDQWIYFLASGKLLVFIHKPDGTETVLSTISAGQLVGENIAFTDHTIRSASVKALEDCVLFQVHLDHFQSFLNRHPKLKYFL